ncbi:hypothetical protein WR25_12814 [Diploscapter pachys]|uniref:Uncharacterized protein n=1 Tax=Diploscapter pachys TaxID=2018661 RepID=A0A2A2KXW1_9BILA|nr:hypothetical protein WR25_12814 [Diploscapter pachys]
MLDSLVYIGERDSEGNYICFSALVVPVIPDPEAPPAVIEIPKWVLRRYCPGCPDNVPYWKVTVLSYGSSVSYDCSSCEFEFYPSSNCPRFNFS